MAEAIIIHEGGSRAFKVKWGNGMGGAGNLIGYDLAIGDVEPPEILDRFYVRTYTPAIGEAIIDLTDGLAIPFGRTSSFRVTLTSQVGLGLPPDATPRIWIQKT